jgi:hypothetical protein
MCILMNDPSTYRMQSEPYAHDRHVLVLCAALQGPNT